MKKHKCYILSIILLASSMFSFAQTFCVKDAMCEYAFSPLAVDTQSPRFSWKSESQLRNFHQSAYQILVSDNLADLSKNKGSLWNSGKVKTDQSLQIEYKGDSLRANTFYYWKIRIYDQKGKASEWSDIYSFRMGLLQPSDWGNAQWICMEQMNKQERIVPGLHAPDVQSAIGDKKTALNKLPQFRKEVKIGKTVKTAVAYLAGLGQFEFFLNGEKVGDHYLDPAWTDYDKETNYVAFDIKKNLKAGTNVLGVMLGNGFYNIPRERYYKLIQSYGYPQMIAKITIEYEDGTKEDIVSDTSWKTTQSPVTYSSIYSGEDYDACLELGNWMFPDYNDEAWSQAIVSVNSFPLKAQYSTPVKIMQEFPVYKRWKTHRGTWLYDLGQNFSGIVSLEVKGGKGSSVKMNLSELLEADESIVGKEGTMQNGYWFTYTLKGVGQECWRPQFTYYGFRYVEISGAVPEGVDNPDNLPVVVQLKGLHTRNSAPVNGRFHCSNDLFNKTYEMINWSIKSNLASYPTDCPHREKLEWIEQTHLMFGSLQYNYGIERLFTKCVNDMAESQTEDGLIPDITPTYTVFQSGFYDSPEWGSAFLLVPIQMYKTYGDTRLLYTYYEQMKKYVDYLTSKSSNYIVSHGLGDWCDLGPNPPGYSQLTKQEVTATAVYYMDIQVVLDVAEMLGKTSDIEKYTKLKENVRKSYNETLYHKEGYYDSNSQTANAISLYAGLVDEDNKAKVLDHLVQDIRQRGNALTAGDVGYNYVLRVLERSGKSDVVYDMNSHYDVPGYGYQLAQGATALPESWEALRSVSHNHFMLGHLMEWLYSYVGGIRQGEESIAFKSIIIAPAIVGDLTSAQVSYDSPYGIIESNWKKEADNFELEAEVPANTEALICLPANEKSVITECGKNVTHRKEIEFVGVKGDNYLYKVGSGHYTFKVRN